MYRVLRHGFTLVELLIVVVVIVILVRIVIVMFDGVRLKANNTKVFDAAVKVGDSLQLFYTKYGPLPYRRHWLYSGTFLAQNAQMGRMGLSVQGFMEIVPSRMY